MKLENDVNVFKWIRRAATMKTSGWTLHTSHDRFIRIERRERRRKERKKACKKKEREEI